MEKRQIAHILFFIRAIDPRDPELDLVGTLDKQLELVRRYGYPATFLVQYDALIRDDFYMLLREKLPENCEVGGWLEIVEPLTRKAGLPWRGREGYAWDWHADVGFSVGYTPDERRLLADTYMEEFERRFGRFPDSMGSWLIDAYTLGYMADRYGITASCNCRDQWGTDGYTLWGGYYGQGYYPSRHNVLCPAQTEENQIKVPVFRMLGSDPIYQYDLGLVAGDGTLCPSELQQVITLEPVYAGDGGGGDPAWVDWYLQENFQPGVSFGYTQIGQENSFGWEAMEQGLLYQFAALEPLYRSGRLCVETLRDTGRWYRDAYALTAVTSLAALTDWRGKGRQSLWYESRFYRANFYRDGRVWIRDIYLFDERYAERYLQDVCAGHAFVYDNLPVIDGNRWSRGTVRAGLYPLVRTADGRLEDIEGELTARYPDEGVARISCEANGRSLTAVCTERSLRLSLSAPAGERLALAFRAGTEDVARIRLEENRLRYVYNGFSYAVPVEGAARMEKEDGALYILAADAQLELRLDER